MIPPNLKIFVAQLLSITSIFHFEDLQAAGHLFLDFKPHFIVQQKILHEVRYFIQAISFTKAFTSFLSYY